MAGLEGKAALVTGSGRGIGAATARKLSEAGARVIINDLDSEVAEEVANSLPDSIPYPADLNDLDAADSLIDFSVDAVTCW